MDYDIKLTWFEALQIKFTAEARVKEFAELIEQAENSEELSKPEYKNHRENLKYYRETWEKILDKMTTFTNNH